MRNGAALITPETIERELARLEPAARQLSLKTPFRRERQLLSEQTGWESREVQRLWQGRLRYWREVLLGEAGGLKWSDLLDLDCPRLRSRRDDLLAGGERAERAWADYIARRDGIKDRLGDATYRQILFLTETWELYDPRGRFRIERAEDVLKGRIRILALEPAEVNVHADYDWLVQHPRDRLFQNSHQNFWHAMFLALAYYHQPGDRWAREWVRELAAHVVQCPRLPDGFNDYGAGVVAKKPANVAWSHYGYVASRLINILLAYEILKDSPALAPRHHALVLRAIRAHASHLHELGRRAFRDNYLVATGEALYLTAALFPELKASRGLLERVWPNLVAGMKRELLPDGCHVHRALGYHLAFIRRPMAVVCAARKLGRYRELPREFLKLVESAVDAFARVCTPICSTPGVNDDSAVAASFANLVRLAARTFERDDWLYIATNGREGREPGFRSALLPDAQLIAMRSDWSADARYLFFNVSPNGGHHHPDTLSVQIWSGGRRLLADPGVGHYYTGEAQLYKRSWWHSCPTLGRRQLPDNPTPRVLHWETSERLDYAVGQIELTARQGHKPAVFRRHVFFVERRYWVVWDEFEGLPDAGEVWENFHFATDAVSVADGGQAARTILPDGTNLLLRLGASGWNPERERTKLWLKYGGPPTPTTTVHFRADPQTAAKGFAALFVPVRPDAELAAARFIAVERLPDGRARLRVQVDGRERALLTKVFR